MRASAGKPISSFLRSKLLPLVLLTCAGCVSLPVASIAVNPEPRTAGHLYVTRPWQAIPEPDRFVQGVIQAFIEELVLAGYDFSGTLLEPDGEDAVRADVLRRNELVPGTVGIYLIFKEAPIGFGTLYAEISCVVYDSNGQIVLSGELNPPEAGSVSELLRPRPDVRGRYWGRKTWEQNLSFLFPPRG